MWKIFSRLRSRICPQTSEKKYGCPALYEEKKRSSFDIRKRKIADESLFFTGCKKNKSVENFDLSAKDIRSQQLNQEVVLLSYKYGKDDQITNFLDDLRSLEKLRGSISPLSRHSSICKTTSFDRLF